jgi:hypothetical protein
MKTLLCFTCAVVVGCGGGSTPPPKSDDSSNAEAKPRHPSNGGPSVSQELGSIDQRAVEQTFAKLEPKLESCHAKGRGRVEYLAGDIKVFLRIDQNGKVRYSFFEEATIGDRDTEKCILDVLGAADWPKPQGGEAEVRNGFGWSPGGERAPTAWGPEKVTTAIDSNKEAKGAIEKCKAGVSGAFRVTAYVEPGEVEGAVEHSAAHSDGHAGGGGNGKGEGKGGGKKGPKKPDAKDAKKTGASEAEHGGRFKTIGVAPPGKDGADKVDCIVDALRTIPLPSPGSYAAKVTFTL